ncbi:unnamed protein product [Closterium sp. NIES-54]
MQAEAAGPVTASATAAAAAAAAASARAQQPGSAEHAEIFLQAQPLAVAAGSRGMAELGGRHVQVCAQYSLAEVVQATSEWAENKCIGGGSFGDVYKGECPHKPQLIWAVKRDKILTNNFKREVCKVWCGVVGFGVMWCGVVWCGVVWCGLVWFGVVSCGVVWCGVVWCGVVWCGVVWCVVGHEAVDCSGVRWVRPPSVVWAVSEPSSSPTISSER